MSKIATKRNGNIELLRFLFSLNVVFLHGNIAKRWGGGYLGVDFFFMITGVFLAKSLAPYAAENKKESWPETIHESWKNVFHRIKAIYPYFLPSCIFGFLVNAWGERWDLYEIVVRLVNAPSDLLFLQCYGYATTSFTGTVWYLSAMLFAIWFLYPIVRREYTIYVKYIAPVVAMLTVGWLLHTYGSISPADVFGTGFLRAIAMISLGCVIYEGTEKTRTIFLTKVGKIIISIVEILAYMAVFGYMFVQTKDMKVADGMAVLGIAIALAITISQKSMLARKFDSRAFIWLGKYSMMIYMNHFYWFANIHEVLSSLNFICSEGQEKIVACCAAAFTSVIVWIVGNWLKKLPTKIRPFLIA